MTTDTMTTDKNPTTTYLFKGKKIDRKKFDQLFRDTESLVITEGVTSEKGTCQIYLKEDDMISDLKGTPNADAVAKVREGIRKTLAEEAKVPEKELAARYLKEDERVTKAYLELAKKTGLSVDSMELLQKAVDARIINSAILYDLVNYKGSWRVVGKGNLSWFGFNDRTSSFRMIATIGCLCEKANYFGRKYWTGGLHFSAPNLDSKNFNNITSSVWL